MREDPEIWAGLILYLVTPCIGWYLVFTELAKGDVELGVSLLAWNVVLQVILMPVCMKLLAGIIVHIELPEILRSVAVFLVIPLGLAFITRRAMHRMKVEVEVFASRVKLPYLKIAILMAVIAAMFASRGDVLFESPTLIIKMIVPGLVFFFFSFLFVSRFWPSFLAELSRGRIACLYDDGTQLGGVPGDCCDSVHLPLGGTYRSYWAQHRVARTDPFLTRVAVAAQSARVRPGVVAQWSLNPDR